jgi:hypothetical protein
MSDPGLRRVLEQVHTAPGHGWTVPAVASLAGLSQAMLLGWRSQNERPGVYTGRP